VSRFSAEIVDVFLSRAGCRVVRAGQVSTHGLPEGEVRWPDALLSDLPAQPAVRAVISDALLRYLVCRWPRTLRGRVEREAWLAHQFRQVHELDMTQWRVLADADATDAPFVACALPRHLEAELRAMLERAGGRLVSLSGQFVRQYNAHWQQMSDDNGALVVLDGARMTLATWLDGHWTRIANRPVAAGDAACAARELTQLKVTGEAAGQGCLYVCGGAVEAPSGWSVSSLEVA